MATISQRISLEGSDEVRKQLEQLGTAGEKSLNQIQDAAQQLGGDSFAQFAQAIAAATEAINTFAAQIAGAASQATPALEKVGQAAEATSEGLAKVAQKGTEAAEAISSVGNASQQATSQVASSREAAEKSSASYAELGLAVVRTGATVVSAGASVAQAGAGIASTGLLAVTAAASVGTFALALGSTLVSGIGAAVGALGVLEGALERIALSDAKLATTLEHLAVNVSATGESFTSLQVGQAAFEQIGVSADKFRSVIASIAKETESFDAGAAFADSAKKINAATTDMQKSTSDAANAQITLEKSTLSLSRAIIEAANSSNTVRQAYLAVVQAAFTLEQAQTKIAESSRVAERNALALEQALLAQQQAYTALERASQDAAQQQINDTLGVVGAKQGVKDAEIALAQAMGKTVSQDVLNRQKIEHAVLAVASAKNRQAEAETKASRDAEDRETKLQQLQLQAAAADQAVEDARQKRAQQAQQNQLLALQLEQAELGLSEARKKAAESLLQTQEAQMRVDETRIKQQSELDKLGKPTTTDDAAAAKARANNLVEIVELIQQIEAGQKKITFEPLVTAQTKIDAVKVRLQDVAKAGGDVGKSLLNIIASLPKADAFKVGAAFGLSETDVDRVRRYGVETTKIDDLFKKIQGAGVLISPEDAAAFDKMNESTQRLASAWARLQQAWDTTFFSTLAASGVAAFNNIMASIVEFTAAGVEAFNSFVGQTVALFGQIVKGWGIIGQQVVDGWGIIGAKVVQLTEQWVTTPIENAWQWIVDTFNSAVGSLSSAIGEATALITSWVTTPVANAWQWIKDAFNSVMGSLFGGSPSSSGSGGFAGGGLLGGRGSGTSDSNLAWVSRGEYITPARAVAQPGVLDFLEALRRSGGNLRDVLDGMGRRFALGGLVHAPISIPAFAGGGMNSVTINFPGLPEITGLRASSGVVDELRKAAALAQVRSGGRKPSRYS
jgi:hypothetical protein